jgi:hypothetical protein
MSLNYYNNVTCSTSLTVADPNSANIISATATNGSTITNLLANTINSTSDITINTNNIDLTNPNLIIGKTNSSIIISGDNLSLNSDVIQMQNISINTFPDATSAANSGISIDNNGTTIATISLNDNKEFLITSSNNKLNSKNVICTETLTTSNLTSTGNLNANTLLVNTNNINPYINNNNLLLTLESAGAATDKCFITQSGPFKSGNQSNDKALSFDIHDDIYAGNISIRKIDTTTNPDTITTPFAIVADNSDTKGKIINTRVLINRPNNYSSSYHLDVNGSASFGTSVSDTHAFNSKLIVNGVTTATYINLNNTNTTINMPVNNTLQLNGLNIANLIKTYTPTFTNITNSNGVLEQTSSSMRYIDLVKLKVVWGNITCKIATISPLSTHMYQGSITFPTTLFTGVSCGKLVIFESTYKSVNHFYIVGDSVQDDAPPAITSTGTPYGHRFYIFNPGNDPVNTTFKICFIIMGVTT